MSTLKDKVAIITGASGGIGTAITITLAKEGARLCLVGRDRERMAAVTNEGRKHTAHISVYQADFEVDDDIRRLGTELQGEFEAIDILIHSAGAIAVGGIETTGIEAFDRQYRINVRAPYLLTQILLPLLRRRSGQIVFINSSAGLTAKAGAGPYAATKHALKAIADSLRAEVNKDGIRVISVYPGRTASPLQAAVHDVEGKPYHPEKLLQPRDVASVVLHALSLPRSAEVTDISVRPLIKP